MELTIERDDNALTARVNGRIDSTNARDFEEAIRTKIEDGDRAVIMDFENLSYISSAGLPRRADDRQDPVEAGC